MIITHGWLWVGVVNKISLVHDMELLFHVHIENHLAPYLVIKVVVIG